MAKPTPTAPQIAAMEADILNKETQQTALTETAALQDAVIASKILIDTAFQDLFDYYNDDIITHYDSERKAINGSFITTPIEEADITGVGGNPPSGRLVPVFPSTDILRIDEFDTAAYTDLDADNELQNILDQAVIEDRLENGYGSGTATAATTTTVITPSSTTLSTTNAGFPETISNGDIYVVVDGSDLAVILVDTITDTTAPPAIPPATSDLDITILVPPATSVGTGATFIVFTGFTDSERDAKTTTDTDLQQLLDDLVSDLEDELNDRQGNITAQLVALGLNDDPDGTSEITTATTNSNTAAAFITAYLISTDISDTGLASLSTERGTRTTELNGRIVEILDNYTGQTEDYYELRYSTANDRGNTQRGTLREQSNAASVKSDMLALAASLQGSIDALNAIIP